MTSEQLGQPLSHPRQVFHMLCGATFDGGTIATHTCQQNRAALHTAQRICSCCGKNMNIAHKKKQVIIRLNGFSAEEHLSETARCLTCLTKVEAEGPKKNPLPISLWKLQQP